MRIVLTGGTGYIGSAVVRELVAAGHAVTALVRSDEAAGKAGKHGADPIVGDLFDGAWTAERFAEADAAAHIAATGGPDTADLDRTIVGAAVEAFRGTAKQFVHTSGIWLWGDNADITETSPLQPPALTAWRVPVEQSLLDSPIAATIVAPGIVYGHGGGIPAGVLAPARDDQGRVRLIGDGSQHWTSVHVDDVASAYRIVLEHGSPLGRLVIASGTNPTVLELAEAAAGAAGVAPENVEDSRGRLGAAFADALLLDQQASGARARELGWNPVGVSLVSQLRSGT
ncbi:NAD-dependent epimerase/dehydratase family protein [Dactylosporangium matsuzakiense]|uniref:NAD-dependent epimerase/dehydratase family protein n=1 Tax=Dactylosporangium matsuzakiense TaxID=53360 RepID=UPI0021C489FD|nr:NAD-dependent epimerase/dehydratase family protein [Dactylosporangium matsuzakiense]